MSIPTHSPTSQSSPPPNEKWYDRYPRWVQVSVPAVVGIILAVGITGWITSRNVEPPAEVMPIPGDATGQAGTTPVGDARACLGGDADLNQAMLDAQQQAALTEAGAAEFTATFLRLIFVLPRPDETTAAAAVLSPKLPDLIESLSDPDYELGGVTRRETSVAPAAGGAYLVTDFDGRQAKVEVIGRSTATTEAGSTDLETGIIVTLGVVDGHWQVTALDEQMGNWSAAQSDAWRGRVAANGLLFSGAC